MVYFILAGKIGMRLRSGGNGEAFKGRGDQQSNHYIVEYVWSYHNKLLNNEARANFQFLFRAIDKSSEEQLRDRNSNRAAYRLENQSS